MTDTAPSRPPRRRRATPAPEEPTPTDTLEPIVRLEPNSTVATGPSRLPSLPSLRPLSPTPTYVGIAVAAAGFVMLAIAWGGVAGEANVARQVPYLVSGGLFGIGLILVGLTVVNVAAKRRDSALRERQVQLLASALEQLGEGER